MPQLLANRFRRLTLLTAFFCSIVCGELVAQENSSKRFPLQVELTGLLQKSRSRAPIPVILELTWNGKGLLEGDLEIAIYDERYLVSTVRLTDLAMATGKQQTRVLLPGADAKNAFGQLTLRTKFKPKDKTQIIATGEFTTRVPSPRERSFTVGICAAWDLSQKPISRDVEESLLIESFDPTYQGMAKREREILGYQTSRAPLRARMMSSEPYSYCAYDVVVLIEKSFASLRKPQLDALLAWVKAGGSLCVLPEKIVDVEHASFLETLLDENVDAIPLPYDDDGRLLISGNRLDDHLRTARCGLGCVVVVLGGQNTLQSTSKSSTIENYQSPEWRTAVARLWKVRDEHLDSLAEFGSWDFALLRQRYNSERSSSGEMQRFLNVFPEYNPQMNKLVMAGLPIQSGGQLVGRTMPQRIRPMPLGLMGFILLLYVLAVGPGDYWFLGKLRKRKLTWVVFPAITVGVTVLTISLSHWFMSSTDDRRAVTFFDLGVEGEVVRSNRFDLLFKSFQSVVPTKVDEGILIPIDHSEFGQIDDWVLRQQVYSETRDRNLVGPANYLGRLPNQYTVTQKLPQWTPQMNRQFVIGSADNSTPAFDWNSLKFEDVTDSNKLLHSGIQKAFDVPVSIFVCYGNEIRSIQDGHVFPNVEYPDNDDYIYATSEEYGYRGQGLDFLRDVCFRPEIGLFSVLHRISPTAAMNFEDLAIHDSSNRDQCLLIVAVDRDNELDIYRKPYYRTRDTSASDNTTDPDTQD